MSSLAINAIDGKIIYSGTQFEELENAGKKHLCVRTAIGPTGVKKYGLTTSPKSERYSKMKMRISASGGGNVRLAYIAQRYSSSTISYKDTVVNLTRESYYYLTSSKMSEMTYTSSTTFTGFNNYYGYDDYTYSLMTTNIKTNGYFVTSLGTRTCNTNSSIQSSLKFISSRTAGGNTAYPYYLYSIVKTFTNRMNDRNVTMFLGQYYTSSFYKITSSYYSYSSKRGYQYNSTWETGTCAQKVYDLGNRYINSNLFWDLFYRGSENGDRYSHLSSLTYYITTSATSKRTSRVSNYTTQSTVTSSVTTITNNVNV